MCYLLILDNYLSGRKDLLELVNILLPDAIINYASTFTNAIEILEQKEIDILFVNTNILSPQEVTIMQKLPENPITILLTDKLPLKPLTKLSNLRVDGFARVPEIAKAYKAPESDLPTDYHKEDTLMLSTALGIYPVRIESILAIEKAKRNFLTVYTQEKILKDVRGTLSEYIKVLPWDFVHISRQCILDRRSIARIITKTREVFINVQDEEVKFVCSREKIRGIIDWLRVKRKIN